MSTDSHTVIVSDAHLGSTPPSVLHAFHRFLKVVPDLAERIIINGDLFEFWFEYKSVIPREHFPTLAALAQLRDSGVEIALTGGNHDRWGIGFWEQELGVEFHGGPLQTKLAGWNSWIVHGDGIAEIHRASRLGHAVCSHPLTARVFRLMHPDIGFGMVRRMKRFICAPRGDRDLIARAAEAQARYARGFLRERTDIDLLVLGHTHRPALESAGENRWYLNPGAWMDGCYALVTSDGPTLRTFDG